MSRDPMALPPTLSYRSRELFMEDVSLDHVMADSGTPAYVYSRARVLENYRRFDEAFHGLSHQVMFAVKANSSGAILSILGKAGAGADIVSVGELFRARRAGIPPERIVFSGVGKTREEMRERGVRPPPKTITTGAAGLTGREIEIARMVASRKSNKEIGGALQISARTVSTHLSNIFLKLSVGSRGELADFVRQNDLLDG